MVISNIKQPLVIASRATLDDAGNSPAEGCEQFRGRITFFLRKFSLRTARLVRRHGTTMSEPYRTDAEATSDRILQLEEELRSLEQAAARRAELQSELEKLRAHMAATRAQGPLEDLRIASPCNKSWEQMVGDDRVRHCSSCDKDVFNLAGMTRAEALQLIANQAGEGLCLRLFRREDGTVLTADCPVGVQKKRVRRLVMIGAGVAASVAGVAGSLWFWADGPQARMGDIHPSPSASAGQRRAAPAVMGTAAALVPDEPAPSASGTTPVVKPTHRKSLPVR